MKRLIGLILDLIFPRKCAFCQQLLQGSDIICAACRCTLPWCESVEEHGEFYVRCVSVFRFEGDVRRSIHRYKFNGRRDYANTYATLLAQCVCERISPLPDLVVYAPISRKRRRQRGYDQGKLLAEALARELSLPCVAALRKVRHTPAQSAQKGADARRANALGAYEVVTPEKLAGKRLLLIDDVVTTGSTLSECARVLLTAGAGEIFCATVARSGREKG